jgi:putative photosynthetic complex assembly protein
VENTYSQASPGADLPPGSNLKAQQKVPPAVLVGVAALVIVLLAAVLAARLTGFDASAVPESPVIDSRNLGFRDLPGGVVEVYDWDTQVVLSSIPSGEGSFLRGVVRSLVRQRRGLSGSDAPFELTLLADRRLTLTDPETGESIDLNAFGPTNLAVFSVLLLEPAAEGTPEPLVPLQ